MSKKKKVKPIVFAHRVSTPPTAVVPIDTISLFDDKVINSSQSPIDNFLEKMRDLTVISLRLSMDITLTQELKNTQNNLVLLGYTSAVESYLREIIRKLILLDKFCEICNHEAQLSFGAALGHKLDMLPEALLEGASFASQKNIIDSIKKHLGLSVQQDNELISSITEFEKICNLRHCIIHRYGKLGSRNAIVLGLDSHKTFFEKPIQIDTAKIQLISSCCENTVIVINQLLFKLIMERTADKKKCIWRWDFRKDKTLFTKYFNLFNSLNRPSTLSVKAAYNSLRIFFQTNP